MIYTKSQSYQGILQIRPINEKVVNYVYNEVNRAGNVFITREVKKKFGLDLYLTNKFFLIQLSKKLKQRFRGTIKRSRTLHSRHHQTSKLIYRTTICFRLTKDL